MLYRQRKLFSSKIRRAIRWEFWPTWVFYTPLVVYIVFLTLKHRGLSFLSVNPGFNLSGVVGDNKSLALSQLQANSPADTAKFLILTPANSIEHRMSVAQRFMADNQFSLPIILKPNAGQRGQDVAVIRSLEQMRKYLIKSTGEILIQEYIAGLEFGVFYIRWPNKDKGQLFSITAKHFPTLTGDGQSTLEQLILNDSRTHYMAAYLLNLHKQRLGYVPAATETFQTVEIGSHCRGSLFLDANEHATAQLLSFFDNLHQSVDGFFFGRYDIRVPSINDFESGTNIKVLELNGVTSEATSIYDPKHGLMHAYKTLSEQWRLAFGIGKYQLENCGAKRVSLFEFLRFLKTV